MKKYKKIILCKVILIVAFLLMQFPMASAQKHEPLEQNFFAPELIMQNQQAIDLADDQRNYLVSLFQEAQQKFTALSWTLQKEMEILVNLTAFNNLDEKKITDQLAKVLQIEQQIKTAQIVLLVKIKNNLTAEQKLKLKIIKEQNAKQK